MPLRSSRRDHGLLSSTPARASVLNSSQRAPCGPTQTCGSITPWRRGQTSGLVVRSTNGPAGLREVDTEMQDLRGDVPRTGVA